MHTIELDDFYVNHNGDFSGDVYITPKSKNSIDSDGTIVIPFLDLKQIVAKHFRDKKISELEAMSDDAVLNTHL